MKLHSVVLAGLLSTTLLAGFGSAGPWIQDATPSDPASAEESSADSATEEAAVEKDEILAGHSYHGEVFNEGPRQGAYLMKGTGNVHFPATTEVEGVQEFIDQGVGQLHGFWYLEAERSFRQALTLDPECAIAYWGAAMANMNNRGRAKGFIEKAVERKEKATDREKKYIDALSTYLKDEAKEEADKRKRGLKYIEALENIVLDHPEDLEAKAFLVLSLWEGRRDSLPVVSYHATSALLDEIFAENAQHPAHHYRIHLWDYRKPEKALQGAAWCGPSAPSIAHMWHMPGHIYSRLKRYEDACYQQEASARVDHAHMMRDRVMPDQIHNFAHNNEWLIRNLIFVGRVNDALDLAKNMTELPRHPSYNDLGKRGSANYGRQRIFNVLWQYRLWDETLQLSKTPYLEATDREDEQVKRLKLVGSAFAATGKTEETEEVLSDLAQRIEKLEAEKKTVVDKAVADFEEKERQAAEKAAQEASTEPTGEVNTEEAKEVVAPESEPDEDKAEEKPKDEAEEKRNKELEKAKTDAARPLDGRLKKLREAQEVIQGYVALKSGNSKDAWEKLKGDNEQDKAWIAELQYRAGEKEEAIKALRSQVDRRKQEVIPLATLAFVLEEDGQKEEAQKIFEQLRETSTSIDIERPLFARLQPIADRLNLGQDWLKEYQMADDLGPRPPLDELGPFRWQPSPASDWTLVNAASEKKSLSDYKGKPVVVIFYLGYGCLHCVEQLQAFAPVMEKFNEAGIEMVAVSTDDQEGLITGLKNFEGEMPIPLLADPDFSAFKKYRCFDDFENQPLHGTFLIDPEGMVRWQDISYEPFMNHEFLLKESQRLLEQPRESHGNVGEVSTLVDED
jgi:peroxiredoxin